MPLEPNYEIRERHEFVVQDRVAGKRLDKYLHSRFKDYSRNILAGLIDAGDVTVEGRPAKSSHKIKAGERVVVSLPVLDKPHLRPDDVPLSVLWEDEWLVAIDKPSGMVVHPSRGHQRGTLVNALLARDATLSGVRSELRPGIVHRLDRDTSGVILVARHDEAHVRIARAFEDREIDKRYLAIVHHAPDEDEFRIDWPIGPHPKNRLKMAIRAESGQAAITRFRVLERLGRFAFVEAKPVTGRTHQIRVHLKARGHPIVADPLYSGRDRITTSELAGREPAPGEEPILERLCLHAARLAFDHPMTGERVEVEAPLPQALAGFLEVLRR